MKCSQAASEWLGELTCFGPEYAAIPVSKVSKPPYGVIAELDRIGWIVSEVEGFYVYRQLNEVEQALRHGSNQ